MGKLSTFLAQRKDLEFDYEREVRAVRDLLRGIVRIEGREFALSLGANESFVAEGHARAILLSELETTLRDVLVRYVHNLCLEGCRLGMSSILFEDALRAGDAGDPARFGLGTPMQAAAAAMPGTQADVPAQQGPAAGAAAQADDVPLADALSAARVAA